MKYVLVDKYDNINSTVDLAGDVGISGARTYFIGVKKLDGDIAILLLDFESKENLISIKKKIHSIAHHTKKGF